MATWDKILTKFLQNYVNYFFVMPVDTECSPILKKWLRYKKTFYMSLVFDVINELSIK